MILEARSPSCFSDHYVLKLDGQARGEYRGRWFSEGVDIRLSGRRRLHLHKESWLGSHFNLADANGNVLAEANRSGFLTSAWDLALSTGSARLVSAGFFNTGFNVVQSRQTTGTVNRVGMCEGGWCVEVQGAFTETDLLLIGLIYHTILERRRSSD
ncbi:MAG: hypothetical protein HN566_12425 [Polaribacter sp.]|nr:hypothetical protein [Polaribacter sp.]